MRAIRILTAVLLTAAGLTAAGTAAAAAVSSPYTVMTGSADPRTGSGLPFATTSVTAPTLTASSVVLTTADDSLSFQLTAPTGDTGVFSEQTTYTLASAATETDAGLQLVDQGTPCGTVTGSLVVTEVATDVPAFAGNYSLSCDGNPIVAGALRYQSTNGYSAVTQGQSSWDFGSQYLKHDGWAHKFTFTNAGSATQHFTSATTGSSAFKITNNGCTAAAGVAAGAGCTITVVPHATSTSSAALATLKLTPAAPADPPINAVPPLTVQLRVLGSDVPPLYVEAGPERVTVNWSQFLPMPFADQLDSVRIYRGSSGHSPVYWRTVGNGQLSTTDYGRRAGTNYYYYVRPVDLFNGKVGDPSPVVAARPWPKYSAGMYHRLSAPVRLVNAHRVSAGHPYALRVVGTAGIPSSHVSAVALTVTAAAPSSSTQVFAYPSGTKRPAAADVDVRRGDTRSNFVLARVGSHGRVLIATTHGSVAISVDVAGYFSAAGLSSKYGQGAALHEYGWPGTILDTTKWKTPVLHAGYYANAPVNFDPSFARHVSSLLVEVTAFDSLGSGTITGFTTNRRPGKTAVLAYRPHVTTSSTAIIRAGLWYDDYDGNDYPSVSFLNRGKKPVQLVVTILGYFDDNTVTFGQRYTPTAARHLLGAKISSGGNRTIRPGSAGGVWTSAFNEKLSATKPARTTTVSLHGVGLGAAPSHGQLHAPAHVSTVSSTIGVTGSRGNEIVVHNAGGTARIDVWSFGRFDAYPVPTTHDYAGVSAQPSTAGRAPGAVSGAALGAARYLRA